MSKKIDSHGTSRDNSLFWVVGIGASAGGLDAFKQLIRAIPPDSGMAYILVQHLDPNHESILVELLQKTTAIPVHEITDHVVVEPDHIYVIPSNKVLTASAGILNLGLRTSNEKKSLPINLFFQSLAEVHQGRAIGVILSGTGTDGTLGLKAIKENGGRTFAQLQETAAYPEMPQSAIYAGVVDFVLTPEGIVQQLLELVKTSGNVNGAEKTEESEGFFFKQILDLLEDKKGVDFAYYKKTTIRRRIVRRMTLKNKDKIGDYLNYLRKNPQELDVLFQDILIPVTDFFRDPKTFDMLDKTVLPDLFKNKAVGEPIRVWVVGCSTGQEAYSMGICLSECIDPKEEKTKIQIFATDISEKAIARARAGIYSKSEAQHISANRLQKYFVKTGDGFKVEKSIREMCLFSSHNILADPPFASIDLISCRNVLIYMDTFLQRKAMSMFHYSLKEKGLLLLGKSESVGNSSDLFTSFKDLDKLFSRKTTLGRFVHVAARRRDEVMPNGSFRRIKGQNPDDDFKRNADDVVLSKSPAGVIVNDQMEIIQFRGATGDWLESPPGKPNLNVFKMAKHGLALELRNGLQKVKTSGQPFTKKGIAVQFPGRKKLVTLEILPLLNTINPYFLILFVNTDEIPDAKQKKSAGEGKAGANRHEVRAELLEKELSQVREDFRTIAEDQEAGNEELLSSNEELVSNGEELRSLNEELEISREELQSTVEELSSANQELGVRNEELINSRKYAEAIVATIREPLIVLDKDLRVKSANTSFYKMFNLPEHQAEERLFYELANRQWDIPELRTLLERTLQEQSFYESYEVKRNFSSIGERVMLLNARRIFTEGNNEDLILLAIEDITERKALEEKLKKTREYTEAIVSTIREPLVVLDKALRVKSANSSYYKVFKETELTTEGILFYKLGNGQWNIPELRTLLQRTLHDEAYAGKYEVKQTFSSIGERVMVLNSGRIFSEGDNDDLILVSIEDITERRILEEKLEKTREYTEAIVTTIREPLIVLDKDLRVQSANSSFYKTFGGTEKETRGKLFYELADSQWDIPELRTLLERTLREQAFYESYEVKRNFSSIGDRIMLLNARRIFSEGESEDLILLAIEDITERRTLDDKLKKNSEYLKAILDSSPQISWTASAEGAGTYFNQFFLDYSGLDLADALGLDLIASIPPETREDFRKSWAYSISSGEDFQKELQLKRHDGIYRWHMSRSLAIRNDLGTITSWVGTISDIHDQKMFSDELEQKVKERTQLLKESNIDLEHSNKNLEQFAFIASHDLQEPLRKIKTFSNMLADSFKDQLPQAGKNLIDKIFKSSERMSILIQDVLDFSRIEHSRSEFVKTDLNEILVNVINDFGLLIIEKNVIVDHAKLPTIEVIPHQLNQLFYNLISNSLKFLHNDRQPVITISCRNLTQSEVLEFPSFNPDTSYCELVFQDNGIGFDEKFGEKIFLIFQRLHSREQFPGTGIGLALCKSIVINHHGEIFAESKEGLGTSFHIVLPLVQGQLAQFL